MKGRAFVVFLAFVAGAAAAGLMPGVSTMLQRIVGFTPANTAGRSVAKAEVGEAKPASIPMDDERIKSAQIEEAKVGSGTIAKRLLVPGTIVPDADRVAHVSVKLSGTVAELRKKIG